MTTYLEHVNENADLALFDGLKSPTNERYWEDIAWVSSGPEELTQFQGKWIAVYNKKVIAADKNGEEAERKAQKILSYSGEFAYLYLVLDPRVIL